jgi:hypothetical protein
MLRISLLRVSVRNSSQAVAPNGKLTWWMPTTTIAHIAT